MLQARTVLISDGYPSSRVRPDLAARFLLGLSPPELVPAVPVSLLQAADARLASPPRFPIL